LAHLRHVLQRLYFGSLVTIAHLGASTGGFGGPAGYLVQLHRALQKYGSGGHDVIVPAIRPQSSKVPRCQSSKVRSNVSGPIVDFLRRARRTIVGAPSFNRPAASELRKQAGVVHHFLEVAWSSIADGVEHSLARAREEQASVLFAHDAPSAERVLRERPRDVEVWLLLHNPMPLALYLTWCWGVPELAWEEVCELPDVARWIDRELDVIASVDRVFIPCAEAVGELAKADRRFAAALSRVEILMTGSAGPARQWPTDSRAKLRDRFGLPNHEPTALYIGNAQRYRGLDALLEALDHLPPRRTLPGVVVAAGPRRDALAFHRRLIALGAVTEVSDLMAAVDAVVNVNRFSLFDLSTIEALEAGCPVVLHGTGGNVAFERLGAGAVMLDDLQPTTIASGLTRCWSFTRDEQQGLARQSRDCYERHLTLRHLSERHVAAYEHAGGRVPVS